MDDDNAFPSEVKRAEDGRFIVPPKSPGRPKGSRNKLGEEFVSDMLADWQEHGPATIKQVREERPADYLKVVASILPKDINFRVGDLEDLTDDELAGELAAIVSQLTGEGGGVVAGVAAALACSGGPGKPPRVH
jgi:hypothetical protein